MSPLPYLPGLSIISVASQATALPKRSGLRISSDRVTRSGHRVNHRTAWTCLPPQQDYAAFSAEKRGESREETAGEWRKGERVLFGSPLSFLHSPALLPRSGNGGGGNVKDLS